MTALTNEEFAAKVFELAGSQSKFSPTAYYDADGDCIEFLARPDNFHAERVDELVTVYISEKTGEVIGSLLKGVNRLCEHLFQTFPGFKIEIHRGRVELVHIFRAKLWSSELRPDDLTTLTYEKLIAVAQQTGVEVDLPKAA
jgi:hypothetical protein